MWATKRREILKIIIVSTVLWIVILAAPLFVSRSSEFLGQDVSALALGILSFYPWVATIQIVVMVFLTWIYTVCISYFIRILFPKIGFFFAGILVAIYISVCFILALVKYPAYLTNFIPKSIDRPLWVLAKYIQPDLCLDVILLIPFFVLTIKGVHCCRVFLKKQAVVISILILFVLTSYFLVSSKQEQLLEQNNSKKNVLIIGIDSLRSDKISPEKTPHLWSLKQDLQTISFEDHIVGIPRTFPSWVEILTGQYSSQTGIRHMFPSFNVREKKMTTIAHLLKEMKYETFAISDFAGDIFPRFDSGFELVDTPNLTLTDIIKFNVTQQFRLYLPVLIRLASFAKLNIFLQNPSLADPKRITERFIDVSDKSNPWLGLLFFSSAHFPYASSYPYYFKFADQKYNGQFFFKKDPDVKVSGKQVEPLEKEQVHALYSGALASIDDEIGNIIRYLKESGQWDHTVIILTADHGEQLFDDGILQGHGEHLRGEWVIKVPLYFKLTKEFRIKRHQVEGVSQSVDIFPSLLSLLDISIPEKVSGMDFAPYVLGKVDNLPRETAYSETGIWFSRSGNAHFQKNRIDYPGISGLLEFDTGNSNEIVLDKKFESIVTIAKHRAIMNKNFKLIYMPTTEGVRYELFDRLLDPHSENNIVDNHPSVVKDLLGKLYQHAEKYDQGFEINTDFFVPRSLD